MTRTNIEKMSRSELIRELKKAQAARREAVERLDEADPERIMYELQINQIQPEMQNRELKESQRRLEESRGRYSDLYDFAPVGYCTLDPEGYIDEINLTASAML